MPGDFTKRGPSRVNPTGAMTRRSGVLALYGEAMLATQRFEQAMVGLVGAWGELEASHDLDAFAGAQDAWDQLYGMSAGRLRKMLENGQRLADPELAWDVERAVEARNLLAHHYLRDRELRLGDAEHAADMSERLRAAVQRFDALTARLDVERLAAMHAHGLTDDHVTTPDEARRMRNYDPALDDDVPPEPWGQ